MREVNFKSVAWGAVIPPQWGYGAIFGFKQFLSLKQAFETENTFYFEERKKIIDKKWSQFSSKILSQNDIAPKFVACVYKSQDHWIIKTCIN